mgnify:CR=1 FL=1|jgi:hypothetical protein
MSTVTTTSTAAWSKRLFDELFGVLDSDSLYLLDSLNEGLLPIIDSLSAATATATVAPETVTIAGQCGHILFLLNQYRDADQGLKPSSDWEGSWRFNQVDEAGWDQLRADLRAAYADAAARIQNRTDWTEQAQNALLTLLAHTSYHVGQVRQLLTYVR